MAGTFPSTITADDTVSLISTPSMSTVPASASTVAMSPSWNMYTVGTLSTIGIDDITAPVATMVSADSLTTAAGATPWTIRSYITKDPTVLPLPLGNTRTFPATLPPRPTRSSPVEPSTPPRKLRGSSSMTTSPRAFPGDMVRPFTITLPAP